VQQWTYFLNKGARLQADYSVMSEDDVHLPLCIIIAQGKVPSDINSRRGWSLTKRREEDVPKGLHRITKFIITARYHHLPFTLENSGCVIFGSGSTGKESFIRWTEMPSVHNSNSTLFWGLVQG